LQARENPRDFFRILKLYKRHLDQRFSKFTQWLRFADTYNTKMENTSFPHWFRVG
ncbi:hypothetical protein PHMEG_00014961, partial [Phytophthora megakarya]